MCVGTSEGEADDRSAQGFNAARSIMCVGTVLDSAISTISTVSMPHAALCMLGQFRISFPSTPCGFNAARSIMCVGTRLLRRLRFLSIVSMPHAALCVLGQSQESSYFRIPSFNAARSMMCVGALSSPALVPRGLRRRFGKSSIFRAVFAVKMRFSDERARGRSSLFLIRCGLRRFGKTQRRNVAYASLWIIFHFTSITK